MSIRKEAVILSILAVIFLGIAFLAGYTNGREVTMSWATQKQEEIEKRHLEHTRKIFECYDELYNDYNELYLKYINASKENGFWEEFKATGYSLNDPAQGTGNITAIGLDLTKNWTGYFNFAAVDPEVIPLGSIIKVKFWDGNTRCFLAVDTGGMIKGNHIDLFFYDKADVYIYCGVQEVEVMIIN
jgi:3D (Asp-Asp-Asp) domain-containing protein